MFTMKRRFEIAQQSNYSRDDEKQEELIFFHHPGRQTKNQWLELQEVRFYQ